MHRSSEQLILRSRIVRSGQRGAAVLITSLILLSMAVILIPTVAFLVQSSQSLIQNQVKTAVAYYATEAAVEDNIYRVKKGLKYSDSNTLTVDGVTATTSITTAGSQKIVSVESQAQTRWRKVQAVMAIDGVEGDFHFGVQVGNGGFTMTNSCKVVGNVYSGGNITGSNSAEITGDALLSSNGYITGMAVGGKAQAYNISNSQVGGDATMVNLLDHTTVGGNAYAANITSSHIEHNATYINIDQNTVVHGQKIVTTAAPTPLPVLPFPFSEAQLDDWEAEAAAGGVITSPCPYNLTNSQSASLGPIKINCNLNISNSAILTVTGPIWVKGNITVSNSSKIKLAGYFGSNGSVIIADDPADRANKGKITISNSAQLLGSGTPGSYLLAVSRNNSASQGGGVTAISVGNGTNSCIFYSNGGNVQISNSVSLKEVTAYRIDMSNSSTVTYESGLANLLFTSGPSTGWSLTDWQEKL